MTTPTNNPATFGGMGKLEFAPTNAPDDISPTWVDITQYVETLSENGGSPLEITRGRQSELNIVESSQLRCTLKNFDGRFTFGNTNGAYGSNWAPAKQIRYSETLASTGQTFVLFQGWIEYPDIAEWQPIGPQYVQLTALDRLTRLARGRPFVSTLGAHILGKANGALFRYWPCLDNSTSTFLNVAPQPNAVAIAKTGYGNGTSITPTGGAEAVLPNNAPSVLADDVSAVRVTAQTGPDGSGGITVLSTNLFQANENFAFAIPSGNTVTAVGWYRPELPSDKLCYLLDFGDSYGGTRVSVNAAGAMTLTTSGTLTATINGPTLPDQAWVPIGIRYGWNTAVIELWVGSNRYTGTLTGSPGGSNFYSQTIVCQYFAGCFAHIQIYIGAPSAWGFTDYLAQYQVAQTGLAQQTTGQRINTLLDYAGVPSGPRQIDAGQSYMNAAKLAGQTPLQALQNASGTERGRLFINGNGNVVFHDRVRIYNV